ncbi:MAG: hypothetical protein J0L78_08995 [Planctomycetes bacterium]|nr:hypothetical protein [Planctomycetota bacterium]
MKPRSVLTKLLICALPVAQAPGVVAGLIPISRTSTYSGVGYYRSSWNYPYEPVVAFDWNVADSCSSFGAWSPTNVQSYGGVMFWHASSAGANVASFIAQAQLSGHLGMQFSFSDDQRTSYRYEFDVVRPTRVSVFGWGMVKLSSSAGYSLVGDDIASGGETVMLAPSRYVLQDTFVGGHGYAHFELKVLDCLGDMDTDARVDEADFQLFVASYMTMLCSAPSMPAGCPADLNHDGVVDDADFVMFGRSYDQLLCP